MTDFLLAETVAATVSPLIIVCFAAAGMLTLLRRPATERALDHDTVLGAVLLGAGPFVATVATWLSSWDYPARGQGSTWVGATTAVRDAFSHELAVTGGVLILTLFAVSALGATIHRRHLGERLRLGRETAAAEASAAEDLMDSPAPAGR